MLVTMKEILDHANMEMYAVAAPNVGGERDARAAMMAAEELCSPIILDVAYKNHPDLPFFGSYLVRLAEQCAVPVAINLDHGAATPEGRIMHPMTAIKAGFTSIMIDRSAWPYEENVAEVKMITELAHSLGISVEAELGHVGSGQDYNADDNLTDPDQALDYIQRTGIDCLAIAIGTAHGVYNGIPKIDFDRLARIKEKTGGFPLVLHGGSGSGDENLRRAASMGINKINVSSELQLAGAKAVRDADFSGVKAYTVWNTMVEGWKNRLKYNMENFGSAEKAWRVAPRGIGNATVSFIEE